MPPFQPFQSLAVSVVVLDGGGVGWWWCGTVVVWDGGSVGRLLHRARLSFAEAPESIRHDFTRLPSKAKVQTASGQGSNWLVN